MAISNNLGFVRGIFLKGRNCFLCTTFLGYTNDGIKD
jgi:hypothetical protein